MLQPLSDINLNKAAGDARENFALGVMKSRAGDFDNAEIHLRKSLLIEPSNGECWYALALLPGVIRPDDISRMRAIFEKTTLDNNNRMLVAYSLGISLDQQGEYSESFKFSSRANAMQSATSTFSIAEQEAVFARHQSALNTALVEYCSDSALADGSPILVIGMPRSGTTLIEQILASHPHVHGAGEVEHVKLIVEGVRKRTGKPFPQNVQKIAPDVLAQLGKDYTVALRNECKSAEFVTDKLPHNFLRIGFFAAILPQVKVIVCQRNAVDTCLSIYQHHFVDEHGYASRLESLGSYYRLYADLIDYWDQLAPGQMLRLDYEALVKEPRGQVERLLSHCGLEFHANCLSFHETERVVSTPSAAQVRKAIYRDSVGRAGNYAGQLAPLIAALGVDNAT